MAVVETLLVGVKYVVDKESLARVSTQFGNAAGVLSNLAAAAVGAAVAVAGFSVAQAFSQDETAKLAGSFRTTTEDLTALQFAARRSGVRTEELSESLRALNANATIAAQEGTSAQAQAMRDLGISARDAAGDLKSPAELIPEIAGGLARMTDTGKRGDAMLKLLGESASRLEPLFEGGAEGIDALTAEAVKFGAVLDSEAAANSEALVDSITNLKAVSGSLVREIGDAVIPHLTEAAEATTEWLLASDNFVRVGLDRAIVGLSFVLDGLHTPLGQAVAGTTALAGSAKILEKVALRLGIGLGAVSLPATAVAASIAFVVLAVDDLIVTAEGGQSVMRRFADSIGVGEEVVTILSSSAQIATDTIALGFTVMGEAVQLSLDSLASGVRFMENVAAVAAEAFPPLQFVADSIGAIGEAIEGLPNLPQFLLGNLAANLEGVADITGRAREGDLDPDLIAALGAEEQGIGSAVATLLESSAQRGETGAGFGIGRAVSRRSEIEDLGAVQQFQRGVLPTRGRVGAGELGDALFGSEERRAITTGTFGSLAPIAALASQPPTTVGQTAARVDSTINLALNLGASIADIAEMVADQARQATITQLSTVEGLQ